MHISAEYVRNARAQRKRDWIMRTICPLITMPDNFHLISLSFLSMKCAILRINGDQVITMAGPGHRS